MKERVEDTRIDSDSQNDGLLVTLGTPKICLRNLTLPVDVSESVLSHQLHLQRARRLVTLRLEGATVYYARENLHAPVLLREAEMRANHLR